MLAPWIWRNWCRSWVSLFLSTQNHHLVGGCTVSIVSCEAKTSEATFALCRVHSNKNAKLYQKRSVLKKNIFSISSWAVFLFIKYSREYARCHWSIGVFRWEYICKHSCEVTLCEILEIFYKSNRELFCVFLESYANPGLRLGFA